MYLKHTNIVNIILYMRPTNEKSIIAVVIQLNVYKMICSSIIEWIHLAQNILT